MAAAAPFITSGIGGLFNFLGNRGSRTSTSSTESESSQTANLNSRQNKVDKSLFRQILDRLKLGPQVAQSDRNQARGQINDYYNAATDRMTENLTARGFGDSGKVGAGVRDFEVERGNAFQNTEATLRDQAERSFWERIVPSAFQFNTPRSFSSTSSSTTTGTAPGMSPYSAVGGGLSDLSSFLFYRNMMNQGGGANPPTPPQPNYLDLWRQPGYVGCFVARALYGADSWRWVMARAVLIEKAKRSLNWKFFWALYVIFGKPASVLVKRSRTCNGLAKRFFDGLLAEVLNA